MRDFSRKTLSALARKGIAVIGTQAGPAFDGDTVYSGRFYKLDNNGCGMIRSHSQVLELVQ